MKDGGESESSRHGWRFAVGLVPNYRAAAHELLDNYRHRVGRRNEDQVRQPIEEKPSSELPLGFSTSPQ